MNAPEPGAEALEATIEEIAHTALESFPPRGRDCEPAVDYANRLLSKRAAELRGKGVDLEGEANAAARDALAARVAALAPGYAPSAMSRVADWARGRLTPSARQPAPPLPSDDEIRAAVDDAFSAPVDGTPERAEVLARRAEGNVDNLLVGRRVMGAAARRARKIARERIAENRSKVVLDAE